MSTQNTQEGLKRVIGIPGLTLSIITGVIGAGIYALPGIVGSNLGAFGIFSYIFCGIMLAAIMLCYAEIGSKVTTSGGSYAYVKEAFGDLPGYVVNWLYFFGWGIIGGAALINVIADALAIIFPAFTNPLYRAVLFFVLMSIMVLINITGAKHTVRLIKAVTLIKLLPLFAIALFGIGYMKTSNLNWNHLPSAATFSNTVLVLFFAFAGFETSLGASGEIKNPKRTVPVSIVIGGLVIMLIYILLQTITQGVLGLQISLNKDAPLAAVAGKIVGPLGATIILIFTIISCFGTEILDILCTPRSLFAAAKDGLFPKYLSKVHPKFATPHLAIITYGSLVFLFSISGGFKQLAILASASILLVYLAVVLSTLKLRIKNIAENKNTFRAPGGWVTPIIGIVSIVWVLSNLGKWEIFFTLIFIAVVTVFYLVTKWTKQKNLCRFD